MEIYQKLGKWAYNMNRKGKLKKVEKVKQSKEKKQGTTNSGY